MTITQAQAKLIEDHIQRKEALRWSMFIKKIKEYLEDEVEINEEHPWHTITDGTEDICRGRLEFAKGLLKQIEKWENENVNK